MNEIIDIFGTVQAAEYLGISFPTLKYHIYYSKQLVPDQRIGGRLIFEKGTLDEFARTRRKAGRPKRADG